MDGQFTPRADKHQVTYYGNRAEVFWSLELERLGTVSGTASAR